ncbi:hypothetical protein PVAR5_8952 [Paecilomyces variotii No. 5]|uniref:Uncharacterized protein n=1 Tax=Byssochlamys spectabilis (strain No. 5 / NBRC 109023) TaxID=1356009 RepID=V5G6V8_BYSSN|nr:hypothetical protein PVAR5_8952 [Paecilomyces variotii No. 5]
MPTDTSTSSSMFVPFSGVQAVDLFSSPFGSSCSEKRSKDTRSSSTHWTPRTATDIQHAATKSSSRYYKSKPKWQASLSRLFRSSPHEKQQSRNGNDKKIKVLDDVEMQHKEETDKTQRYTKDEKGFAQRPSRMSSLKIPRSRTKTGISDREKEKKSYEKPSSMTTSSTTIFTPNSGRSSTLKKRRPQSHRDSSLSTLLSLRDPSTRVPSATSTAAEIPSFEPRVSPPSSTQQGPKTSTETPDPSVRRRSTIKDWKKKTDRLSMSLSLSVLAPSARLSAYGASPHCKSTFEWDRISLDEETTPKYPVYNTPKTVTRSATESKTSAAKQRNSERLSSPPTRSKTEPASRSTSRIRHKSSIDIAGDGEFTSLMEVANGNTMRNGGVEALELV